MRTLAVVILLLATQVWGHAQSDPGDGIIEFYTTKSSSGRTEGPVVYSEDRKLGEITNHQIVRVAVSPGTYQFGLTPNAPTSQQISVSIKSGQHIYLRVTSQGFFLGSATEAVASMPGVARADSASTSVANVGNTDSLSAPTPSVATGPISLDAKESSSNATIFLYRRRDREGSDQQLKIYTVLASGTRPLATLQKGEYFAVSVSPGLRSFSWTQAPARGQTVAVTVGPGQRIFLEVQLRSITETASGTAPADFQGLQPIEKVRVFDQAVLAPVQILDGSTMQEQQPGHRSETDVQPQVSVNKQRSGDEQAARPQPSTPQQPANKKPSVDRSETDVQPQVSVNKQRSGNEQAVRPQPSTPQQPANKKPSVDRQSQQSVTQPQGAGEPERSQSAKTRELKIHGYVTAINPPTSFDIEDYRITRDAAFKLEFDNPSTDLTFKIEDVRVGTELEIKGDYDDSKNELKAKSIKVDMDQFRRLKDTAILDRPPSGVEQVDGAWRGIFFVNGQRIQVTPETKVVFRLTGNEKNTAEDARKRAEKNPEASDSDFRPLSALTEISAGMLMTYEGKRDAETGGILADRVEFSKNEFEKGEELLWKQLNVRLKPGIFQSFSLGELSISQVGRYKLLTNEEVQAYVTRLGESLIPEYLKAVPDSDPAKIHFRSYVVIDKEPNAFALPNGIFVISSGLFDMVENEAQLAAVVAHEIAHATQEHTWRQMNYDKNALLVLRNAPAIAGAYGQKDLQNLGNLIQGAARSGYSPALENQADRIGLEYMVRAGYDPREAPRLWKQMTKAYGLQTTATRRSYLMNEIKNNYSNVDYSLMKVDSDNFDRIKIAVKEGASGKKTIKVKGN
jgi:Zn-dependent protease with chaperone function